MKEKLTARDIVAVLERSAGTIEENKDYITGLDAAIGDGDHWVNMNQGFQKLVSMKAELEALPPAELLKKIGMTLMATIGGSSGVLYGDAYITAHRQFAGVEELDARMLYAGLAAGLEAMMKRGNAKPGDKTMIDTYHPAVEAYGSCLEGGGSLAECVEALCEAGRKGMESTLDMPASKGRAYYQADKGVGHLDPGAVTLLYQLEALKKQVEM